MPTRSRAFLLHLAVYGFYLAVALVVTYPLITELSTAFAGFVYGDAYEMAHHVWWFKTALQTGQNPFYHSLLAYPDGIAGVTVWANPLQSFPAWLFAFVLPLPAALNLQLLLTLALNGWSLFFLARFLLRGFSLRAQRAAPLQETNAFPFAPALLAGLVFMLFPTFQGHVGVAHLGQIAQWMMPLYVYALFRLREQPRLRTLALVVVCFFLAALGHTLQIIYVLLPLTLVYALWLAVRREWLTLCRTLVGVFIGAALLGLFLLPVLRDTLATSAYTGESNAVRYSADLLSLVTPSFRHPLFGRLAYTHQVLGVNIDEGAAYVGVLVALLAVIGLWKVRAARLWLALGVVAWVLSLGPLLKLFDQPLTFTVDGYTSYITLPFALLGSLPLFSLARAPGRFSYGIALAVALLAGYGTAYLWRRFRLPALLQWVALALLLAGVAFEYQTFAPLPTTSAAMPAPVVALAERTDIRAVLDVPWDSLIAAKYGMVLQTAHQHPLIAGQETRATPVSPAKLALLQATLDPALLRSVGADVVIVHREQDTDGVLAARAREQLGAPLYEDGQIAVFETPITDAEAAFAALPPPAPLLTDRADSHLYAPADGWVNFSARLTPTFTTDAPRTVQLLLDGVPAAGWALTAETDVALSLPLAAGFHTRSVALADLAFDFAANDENSVALASPVQFDRGLALLRARLPARASAGETLPVALYWGFDEPRSENDIRFVHIIDAAGELVAQSDLTLGSVPAGETRAETVSVPLPPDLPAGEYTVSVGWYRYPDISNFCVLNGATCIANAAMLGSFTVE
jgi:methionine-rich copper-binding protein CopC